MASDGWISSNAERNRGRFEAVLCQYHQLIRLIPEEHKGPMLEHLVWLEELFAGDSEYEAGFLEGLEYVRQLLNTSLVSQKTSEVASDGSLFLCTKCPGTSPGPARICPLCGGDCLRLV